MADPQNRPPEPTEMVLHYLRDGSVEISVGDRVPYATPTHQGRVKFTAAPGFIRIWSEARVTK